MAKPDEHPSAKVPSAYREAHSESGWVSAHARSVVVPSFDFRVEFAAASAIGIGRSLNQDALSCAPELGLFAIADGMGGHAAGEVAARVAIEVVERTLRGADARSAVERYASEPELENRRAIFALLGQAMIAANDAVIQAGEREASQRGMGTTLDVVLLVRDRAFFAHVGDSRAYMLRPTAMLQLTNDHAAYDSLRTSGKRAPNLSRSPLTNSIGHRRRLVVDCVSVDIALGDRIVLCTDGISNALDGEPQFERLCRKNDATEVCEKLIASAREHGGHDDASVVLVRVQERFAKRHGDAGPRTRDLEIIASSPLLSALEPADVLSALAAGVEVEIDAGAEVPRTVANDRVAYIVLDGLVELPNGRRLGPAGLLMGESLLDVSQRSKLPKVVENARLLRIRHDDFNQVCAHNLRLAAEMYKRLARHLATAGK
jgi:serine/threonine protein phosphatase PrpC